MSRAHLTVLCLLLAGPLLLPLSLLSTGLAEQPAAPSRPAPGSAKPLAVVGGEAITDQDLIARLEDLSNSRKADAATEEGRKDLLNKLIEQRLASREAERLGLDRTPEVARKLRLAREKVLFRSFLQRYLDQVQVTNQEAQDYFESHKVDFPNKTFKQAKDSVVAALKHEKAGVLARQRIKELWERGQVKINEAQLSKLDLDRVVGKRRPSAKEMLQDLQKRGMLPEELEEVLKRGTLREGPPPKR